MKLINGGELDLYCVNQAQIMKYINHVNVNGYDNVAVFQKFVPTDLTAEYGLAEDRYFITFVATYGHDWDGNFATKHQTTYEVGKEEGNALFKMIMETHTFQTK